MNDILLLILTLSLSGSIIALVMFCIKPFVKNKIPKTVQYYLWVIVLIRLLLPVSLDNSLMNSYYLNQEGSIKRTESDKTVKMNVVTNEVKLKETKAQPVVLLEKSSYLDFIKTNLILIWLVGMSVVLIINLISYIKFIRCTERGNFSPGEKETALLKSMLNSSMTVSLFRNKYIGTPMLIGLLKPKIVIPDIKYSEQQLQNILAHELVHLRYFDIAFKWLTLIVSAVHWFNPIMYFIKREINHVCELACDERVIKKLDRKAKQSYGETLISMVQDNSKSLGALSTTMCEEKRTLKERLLSIMSYSEKSMKIRIVSAALVFILVGSSIVLGASIGSKLPPNIYIASEFQTTKEAVVGNYNLKRGNRVAKGEGVNFVNTVFGDENIIYAGAGEVLNLRTQKRNLDRAYAMSLVLVEVYREGELYYSSLNESAVALQELRLQAPVESGEYIYSIKVKYPELGEAEYGFMVRVDIPIYDLNKIEKSKTKYVGNHVKVMGVLGGLPIPFNNSRQQYISIRTSKTPYKLTAFYEAKEATNINSIKANSMTLQNNALVLFYMIDNLEEVSFMYRTSPSTGDLDTSKYEKEYFFTREQIIKIYGKAIFEDKNLTKLKYLLEVK